MSSGKTGIIVDSLNGYQVLSLASSLILQEVGEKEVLSIKTYVEHHANASLRAQVLIWDLFKQLLHKF